MSTSVEEHVQDSQVARVTLLKSARFCVEAAGLVTVVVGHRWQLGYALVCAFAAVGACSVPGGEKVRDEEVEYCIICTRCRRRPLHIIELRCAR